MERIAVKSRLVLPALRGVSGEWTYYSTLMSAKQISEWIMSVKNIREANSLEEVLQRKLKPRVNQIAKYLIKDSKHFFNTIIVGVFDGIPDWHEFDLSSAQELISNFDVQNDIKQSLGLLVFTGNEKMFAIDGQHRVEGIKKAIAEDSDGNIVQDQYSIIFVGHIDDAIGMKKSRKLFSDINKNAKAVSKGDKVIIDEEDLIAIVARRIYSEYPPFKGGSLIEPSENASLESNDITHFTNLLAVYKVCQILSPLYGQLEGSKPWDERNVRSLQEIVSLFFYFSIRYVPEFNDYFIKRTLTLEQARIDNKYLLFRPVGLFLLAKLYLHFYRQGALEQFSRHLGTLRFIMPESPLNNVLWVDRRMEVREAYQKLALDLSKYLLGAPVDEVELLARYRFLLKSDTLSLPGKIIN